MLLFPLSTFEFSSHLSETSFTTQEETLTPDVGLTGRNLLLNLPGPLLADILDFHFACSPALWLWLTGCRELQSRLARHVSQISFESKTATDLSHLKGWLPRFLGCFPLRKLRLRCIAKMFHREKEQLAAIGSLLRSLNPGLKLLDVKMGFGSSTSSAHLFNTTTTSATAIVDLAETFPLLEELQVDRFAPLDIDRLPRSLTSLTANLNAKRCLGAEYSPKSLTSWHSMTYTRVSGTEPLLPSLPPSLTHLGHTYEVENDAMLSWPPRLASVSLARMNARVASSLPYSLTSLKLSRTNLGGALDLVGSLPSALTSLEWEDVESGQIGARTLRKLPRTLTSIIGAIDANEIEMGDWPPSLTRLKFNWQAGIDKNSGTFAALLPRSITSLSILKLSSPLASAFYSNLPPRITELRCNAINIVDSPDLVLPPALVILGSRGIPRYMQIHPQVFPYGKLPRTLTELCIGELEMPLSKLVHLPPLNRLEVAKFQSIAIKASPEIVEKVNALRQFGLPHDKRTPALAAPTPNDFRVWDLLPKTLSALIMRESEGRDVIEVINSLGSFPYLPDLEDALQRFD